MVPNTDKRPAVRPYRLATCGRGEEEELRALVRQAFELRETPYLRDAVEAIVDWADRRPLARLEREQERLAALIRLLRETDPARLGRAGRKAA